MPVTASRRKSAPARKSKPATVEKRFADALAELKGAIDEAQDYFTYADEIGDELPYDEEEERYDHSTLDGYDGHLDDIVCAASGVVDAANKLGAILKELMA